MTRDQQLEIIAAVLFAMGLEECMNQHYATRMRRGAPAPTRDHENKALFWFTLDCRLRAKDALDAVKENGDYDQYREAAEADLK